MRSCNFIWMVVPNPSLPIPDSHTWFRAASCTQHHQQQQKINPFLTLLYNWSCTVLWTTHTFYRDLLHQKLHMWISTKLSLYGGKWGINTLPFNSSFTLPRTIRDESTFPHLRSQTHACIQASCIIQQCVCTWNKLVSVSSVAVLLASTS